MILADLRSSDAALLITSYTSLDRVIEFLADVYHRKQSEPPAGASVVIGHEPSRARRTNHRDSRQRFEAEIADYWFRQGISIARCAQVVAAIQCVSEALVSVRTSNRRVIHAKIYVTREAATLGSSNYSHSGMRVQAEANCRFVSTSEPQRYRETAQAADVIWNEASDYQAGLLALLRKLLRKVNWEDALAQACAELLEGAWARRYLPDPAEAPHLWPSQVGGIAQALWILNNTGSVLVADATGSGKTRMGAHLLRAVQNRRMRTGARGSAPIALVCPPAVDNLWRRETVRCDVNPGRYSHGVLSHHNASAREDTIEAIRRASILAVDEAHNYLNRASLRTQAMYRNQADHVVLFTATPSRIAAVLGFSVATGHSQRYDQQRLCVHGVYIPLLRNSREAPLAADFPIGRCSHPSSTRSERDGEDLLAQPWQGSPKSVGRLYVARVRTRTSE